jgi:aryl-alcohol dehydrogenase-like predicted oxidoreductase
MGEHWDAAGGAPFADHSFEALRRSLDASLARLGRIDILQLHKTTPAVLASDGVARAWEYARSLGIARLGPSVSDLESARMALEDPRFSAMQLPFNQANPAFGPVLDRARSTGMWIAVNRPFAMGALVHGGADKRAAFDFIRQRGFAGAILTGTTSQAHLRENWEAFQE